uniref:Uncharacterized protein n=1 Tax=Solanum lycopersicum TaxID=4081 RepID=A0A3Q7H8K9_SOLLC
MNIKLTIHELDELQETHQMNIKLTIHELDELQETRMMNFLTIRNNIKQPKRSHWKAAIRVMKYVKRELGLAILLSSTRENKLSIGHHAPNTRKSVSGFLVKHGSSLISWKSKKQKVSRS